VIQLDGGDKELVLKSALSLEIFPISWCITNGVPLWIPKSFICALEPTLIPKEEISDTENCKKDTKEQENSGWSDLVKKSVRQR